MSISTHDGAVLIIDEIDVFASNESPLRAWSNAGLIGTNGMYVAHSVDLRRVGDENISNFSL
jgi:hypothetical protein